MLPVIAEVPAATVGALAGTVLGLRLLEQRPRPPRRAVEHDRRGGGGRHRPEVTVELFNRNVLRLVDLQQQIGGVAEHVGARLGGEEAHHRAPAAH